MTAWDDEAHIDHELDSGTPGVQGGLRSFGRSLSKTRYAREQMTDIFQLPQIYWNHLTNNDQIAGLPATNEGPLNLTGNAREVRTRSTTPGWTGPEGVLRKAGGGMRLSSHRWLERRTGPSTRLYLWPLEALRMDHRLLSCPRAV